MDGQLDEQLANAVWALEQAEHRLWIAVQALAVAGYYDRSRRVSRWATGVGHVLEWLTGLRVTA